MKNDEDLKFKDKYAKMQGLFFIDLHTVILPIEELKARNLLPAELTKPNLKLLGNFSRDVGIEIVMLEEMATEMIAGLAKQGNVVIMTTTKESKRYMENVVASLMPVLHRTIQTCKGASYVCEEEYEHETKSRFNNWCESIEQWRKSIKQPKAPIRFVGDVKKMREMYHMQGFNFELACKVVGAYYTWTHCHERIGKRAELCEIIAKQYQMVKGHQGHGSVMSDEDILPPWAVEVRRQYINHIYKVMPGTAVARKRQVEKDKLAATVRGEKVDDDPLFTSKEKAIFLSKSKRRYGE